MEAITSTPDSAVGKIVDHLQRNGEATIKELKDILGVSTTAVREHLMHLQARRLVATRLVRQGLGRPHLAYFLTEHAQSLFPKSYDSLVTMLLREITSQAGPDGAQRILDAVGQRLADQYRGQVTGDDAAERLATLQHALEARGIPTAIQPSGDGLQLFACPYLDVVHEHPGVCVMERRMLEQLLGEPLQIDTTIRDGHKSCYFSVLASAEEHANTTYATGATSHAPVIE